MLKKCSKCKIHKGEENFGKDPNMLSGLKSICKDCISIYKKEYRKLNKEKLTAENKEYRKNNKTKLFNNRQKYYQLNKTEIQSQQIKRRKQKIELNPLFRIKVNLGSSIRMALTQRGFTKESRTFEILGCSYEEFKIFIESKFEPWMNWENQGKYNGELNYGWDFDHIIPVSSAKSKEDIIKLNHFSNFQPLCSKVNRDIKKGLS